MNKAILFDGVRLIDFKGETLEEDFCNEVELTDSEYTMLTALIGNNPEELPLYELIELNASEELKSKLMTCSDKGEMFTFLPTKAYLQQRWGYIRETREMAFDAAKKNPESSFTGFEDYLEILYPGKTWVHDRPFGKHGNKTYRIRPDYLCEEEKIIIEFDGLQHYTNPKNIIIDQNNQAIYESFGYKVIRIPYFIQITNEVAKEMFGVEISEPLFDPSLPSMSKKWQNTPAFCCYSGLLRMAKDFKRFPQQYEVNMKQLKSENNEALTGYELLSVACEGRLQLTTYN